MLEKSIMAVRAMNAVPPTPSVSVRLKASLARVEDIQPKGRLAGVP